MRKRIITILVTVLMALMCTNAAWGGESIQANADLSDAGQENHYLTFAAEADNSTITLNYDSGSNVMYSLNGGNTWSGYSEGTAITLGTAGDSVCFKGDDVVTSYDEHFAISGKVAASGDVTSLTNEAGGDCSLTEKCYSYMFYDCEGLTEAPELPATILKSNCYSSMFSGCTSLTEAPELPATKLAMHCYSNMFADCISLTEAPELPATTLEFSCYNSMFIGCTDLTEAPKLPATTMASSCYSSMFAFCEGLTKAPELPATTLAFSCYSGMFSSCTGLTEVPELPATKLEKFCYMSMFAHCTNIKLSEEKTGDYTESWSIPSGATSANYWSSSMFYMTGGTFADSPEIGKTYYYQPRVEVTGISLDKTAITLAHDEDITLTASVLPANASVKDVIWSSSNESVASVSDDGIVSAGLAGTAVITATTIDGRKTASCNVTVCHDLEPHAAVAATCTTAGNSEYWSCTTCKKYFSDAAGTTEIAKDSWVINKLGHSMEHHAAVAATCTTAGNSEYWYCKTCKKYFSDAAGTTEVAKDSWVIPKLVAVASVKMDKTSVTAGTSVTEINETDGLPVKDEDKNLVITKASTVQLTATVSPANATDKSLTWTSSDETVATVDKNGLVTVLRYGKATITATAADGSGASATCTVQGRFYDVNGSATKLAADGSTNADYQYFYNPVYWAAELGITQGYDRVYFGVGRECTREEFVMFIWRHAGKPEAKAADADKFTDVKESDLSVNFKKAISWAVSKGIIKGYSDGTFGVRKAIVRKDALIMLYRYAGKPPVSVEKTGYTDVDGVYGTSSDTFKAIVWAKANGITNGFTASQAAAAGLTDPAFGSLQLCVREQMITFLYRYNNLKK